MRAIRRQVLVLLIASAMAMANSTVMAAEATHLPVDVAPEQLLPGEYLWHPEIAPAGPLLMVVDLPTQRATLYRNGVRIAVTTVSTGKAGKDTPPGVFTILQKHATHFSSLYDAAPMPFMQRLTWDGIALHAGRIPGYPASHGCVRLPLEFARHLFAVTDLGMTVVVADTGTLAPQARSGWLAPSLQGDVEAPAPLARATLDWHPERAPTGPLTLLLSGADHTVRVLRNGVEIGTSPINLAGMALHGTHVLQMQAGATAIGSRFVADAPRLRWTHVALDGSGDPAGDDATLEMLYASVQVPPDFARVVYAQLQPGTTVVFTDLALPVEAATQSVLETGADPADDR
ncbi:MAG: L,D-transpeptidase family protein [Arenimonas sp.]